MKRLLIPVFALVGLLAAGCIVQFGTLYKDTDENTHFVALARNLTKVDVVNASVQVDFLDSGNNIIATQFVAPCTRTLQHGASSPVEVTLPKISGLTVHQVTTTVKPISFGTKAVPDLDVNDVVVTVGTDTTTITGTVDNNDTHLYAVQVCAALLDGDGNVVKVGRVFVDTPSLADGASSDFTVTMANDADAEDYQLWIDATTHSPNDVTAPVVVGPDSMTAATATPTKTPTRTPTVTGTPPTATATATSAPTATSTP